MVYVDNNLVTGKVLLNEPIHDSFTPSLAVTVTRESKIKHQKYFNSRVVKIAVVRRTPQCITQKKEAMKSNFSLPVMSLLIFHSRTPILYPILIPIGKICDSS